jgi:hypothetical protein
LDPRPGAKSVDDVGIRCFLPVTFFLYMILLKATNSCKSVRNFLAELWYMSIETDTLVWSET